MKKLKDVTAARQEMRVLCQATIIAHPDDPTANNKQRAREGRLGGIAFGNGAARIAFKYGLAREEGLAIADGVVREFGLKGDAA